RIRFPRGRPANRYRRASGACVNSCGFFATSFGSFLSICKEDMESISTLQVLKMYREGSALPSAPIRGTSHSLTLNQPCSRWLDAFVSGSPFSLKICSADLPVSLRLFHRSGGPMVGHLPSGERITI